MVATKRIKNANMHDKQKKTEVDDKNKPLWPQAHRVSKTIQQETGYVIYYHTLQRDIYCSCLRSLKAISHSTSATEKKTETVICKDITKTQMAHIQCSVVLTDITISSRWRATHRPVKIKSLSINGNVPGIRFQLAVPLFKNPVLAPVPVQNGTRYRISQPEMVLLVVRSRIQGGPKNWHTFLYALTSYALTSWNIDRFSNIVHCLNQENICNNTVTTCKVPPHLKCVATLPCEMSLSSKQQFTTNRLLWQHTKKLTTGNNVFIVSLII